MAAIKQRPKRRSEVRYEDLKNFMRQNINTTAIPPDKPSVSQVIRSHTMYAAPPHEVGTPQPVQMHARPIFLTSETMPDLTKMAKIQKTISKL